MHHHKISHGLMSEEEHEGHLYRPELRGREYGRHELNVHAFLDDLQKILPGELLTRCSIIQPVRGRRAVFNHHHIADERALGKNDEVVVHKELLERLVPGEDPEYDERNGQSCEGP